MANQAKELFTDLKEGRLSRRDFVRRAALLGVGIASTSNLLAACGDNTPTSASATTKATNATGAGTTAALSSGKLTGAVEFWSRETQSNGIRQPIINARLADLQKDNPGITSVKAQFMVLQESVQKTQAALAAGSPPEVGQQGPAVAMTFASAGNLLPLDDLYKELGGADRFLQLTKEYEVRSGGMLYAIPWYGNAWSIYYHKDLLAAAGVQPPTSWDEWSAAAKALTKGEDQYGFILPTESSSAGQLWVPLGVAAGGVSLDKDGKITVNNQSYKDALTFASSFAKNKYMPEAAVTYKNSEMIKLFQTKKVAMTVYNGDLVETIRAADAELVKNLGIAPIPVRRQGDTQRTFAGGWQLFVFAKSKNLEGAKSLIKYLLEEKWYSDYLQRTNGAALPYLKSVAKSDYWQSDPLRKVPVDQLPNGVFYGSTLYGIPSYWGAAESQLVFAKPLTDVIAGKTTVDGAIATMESELNKLAKGGN